MIEEGTMAHREDEPMNLRTYALSPDPDLLHHIRNSAFTTPNVDAVAVHRALGTLTSPVLEETER